MATDIYGRPPGPPGHAAPSAWTAGRIVSLVIGSVLALISLGLLVTGGILLWADQSQRSGGYLTVPSRPMSAAGYAVTSDVFTLEPGSANWVNTSLLGSVRVRVTSADAARPVFVGIGPAGAVQSYLAGSQYSTVTGYTGGTGVSYRVHSGNVSPPSPLSQHIWSAQVSGTGQQTLTWHARGGQWIVVVMNANGTPGVSVTADAGATIPALTGIATGFLVAGAVVLAGAVVMIVIPIRLASRSRAAWQAPGPPPAGPPAPPAS